MNNPVLACRQLAKSYTDASTTINVLCGIDFAVQPGEMIAIVGNSGSGKSTLLHLLGGLDKPTSGQVLIDGQDIHHFTEADKCQWRNRTLGFIYQFHYLLPEFTALENVAMPLLIRGEHPTKIIEKAQHLLQQVGLAARMSHRLNALSGGERQRVAIARALVNEPLCILADEPTGNLDPANADKVLKLFCELQATHRTSVVMVTHDPMIAEKAQRQYRIEEGKLMAV